MATQYHTKTLNSLERKGYLAKFHKANGDFWEITDSGAIRTDMEVILKYHVEKKSVNDTNINIFMFV